MVLAPECTFASLPGDDLNGPRTARRQPPPLRAPRLLVPPVPCPAVSPLLVPTGRQPHPGARRSLHPQPLLSSRPHLFLPPFPVASFTMGPQDAFMFEMQVSSPGLGVR